MQNDILEQVQFRPAAPADEAFIFSTWLKSYKHSSRFAQPITPKIFFARHHKIVERILAMPQTQVIVCASKEDQNTILGYLAFTAGPRPIVHFCYVKVPFRKMGIAKGLFDDANIALENAVYTHRMEDLDWVERKYPGLEYDPYLI